jgi:hypothetical protein
MAEILGLSKSIFGFNPVSAIPGCTLWLDGADNATMNSTSAVTVWNDKSGNSNTMTGSGTWSGSNMVFNGTTNAFSNLTYVFPFGAYSLFAVYSNTVAPAAGAYMNVVYGSNGFPMLGTFDVNRYVTARSVVANTGALSGNVAASSNVLVDATYLPSTMSPFINGTAQTTRAGTTLATTGVFIGGPSNYFNGTLSELLIYNNTLTVAQRQSVEGYLANKWGTLSSLPATHPFKIIRPFSRYFAPVDIPGCTLWMDGGDNSTMNSTTAVTIWRDKSGSGNNMAGTGTWSGSNMVFNGSTNAFSNLTYVFPSAAYSLFAVYSNTVAPAAAAYMNVMYGSNGFPMLGTFDVNRNVTARSVVANTGALDGTNIVGWAAQIASTAADDGRGIATDPSGNVLVIGDYSAALTIYNQGAAGTAGATLPFTGGSSDVFIAKYTSAGAVTWAARIASTGQDNGRGIATDPSGNVLVTGYYGEALTFYNQGAAGTGVVTLPLIGSLDVFVAKYLPDGTVSWAARIGGTGQDIGLGIATDSSGNVLVIGYYAAAVTFYNQGAAGASVVTLPFIGSQDVFVAKYLPNGTVSWAARIAGTTTSSDLGNAIATDPSGNVLVTGYYTAAMTFYNQGAAGASVVTLPLIGGADAFVAKYTSAGAVSWAARIGGAGTDIGNGIATDSSGNVLVTGYYSAAVTFYNQGAAGAGVVTLPSTGGNDCFIAKYTLGGAVSWAARIAGTADDRGNAIATDSSGNVLVTGFYTGAVTFYNQGAAGASVVTLPFIGGADAFIAKYTSAGAVSWAARIAGTGLSSDTGRGIATDSLGNVFVTGQYGTTLTFYNQGAAGIVGTTLPATSGTDCFIVKYNPDGFIRLPTPASSNVLVDATYLPSTMSPFVNGNAALTLAGTTLATTGIFLGGPSNYFNGSLSELIIYSRTLTSGQREQVEGYLLQKWGLRSQIVSTQPYLTLPPSTSTLFLPTNITGCTLWLNAADSTTTTSISSGVWADRSGNARDTTSNAGSSAFSLGAINGVSAVQFPVTAGISCLHTSLSTALPSPGLSLFFVARTTSNASGGTRFFSTLAAGNFQVQSEPGALPTQIFAYTPASGESPSSSSLVISNAVPFVYSIVIGSTFTTRLNGVANTFSPLATGSHSSTRLTIGNLGYATSGANSPAASNAFTGLMGEVIMYNVPLTTIQHQSVEGYLAWKWGTQALLPTTHAFHKFPPGGATY